MFTATIYLAGKMRADWREELCATLARSSGYELRHLDPSVGQREWLSDPDLPYLIFGRDCSLIARAESVVVYLTDDISVGGSQEMLIAKYFKKPLIGIAPWGGKFLKDAHTVYGGTYEKWIHPFVRGTCDALAETPEEAGKDLARFLENPALSGQGH
jgi:hypothetical protein